MKLKLKHEKYRAELSQPDDLEFKRRFIQDGMIVLAWTMLYFAGMITILWALTHLPDEYFEWIEGMGGLITLLILFFGAFVFLLRVWLWDKKS